MLFCKLVVGCYLLCISLTDGIGAWNMKALLKSFLSGDQGATAIEYGLIAALISVVIISGLSLVNGQMIEMYEYIGSHFSQALSG